MKLLGLLTAGALCLAQGNSKEQCVDLCPDSKAYKLFDGYLQDLTNCEKKELLPVMTTRHDYIQKTNEFFDGEPNLDSRLDAVINLGEVYVIHRKELLLLEAEFKKTQSMLFADCVSDESQSILAKHLSILAHAIEEHNEAIAYIEEQM